MYLLCPSEVPSAGTGLDNAREKQARLFTDGSGQGVRFSAIFQTLAQCSRDMHLTALILLVSVLNKCNAYYFSYVLPLVLTVHL